MADLDRRRDELRTFIDQSRAVQRRLRAVLGLGVAVTVALGLGGVGAPLVPLAAAVTAIVVGAGFWITHGHIADFEGQLETLRAAAQRRGPR